MKIKLLIQKIHTEWTKKSRGGQSAAVRNAVPEFFPPKIPSTPIEGDIFAWHYVGCYEWKDFVPKHCTETRKISYLVNHECVDAELGYEICKIFYIHRPECVGAPIKVHSSHPEYVVTLFPEEWCQIICNGRTTRYHSGEWCYKKIVYNCFFCCLSDLSNSIQAGNPKSCKKDLANLW